MIELLICCLISKIAFGDQIMYQYDTLYIKLSDQFGLLENPTYSMEGDTNVATIINQFSEMSPSQKHNQNAGTIIQAKAQTSLGYWTNHFLFLEISSSGTYNLHYSENQQEENVATPKFNEHLTITKNGTCFDAEQYDINKYIVDCGEQTDNNPMENKLFVIYKDASIKQVIVNNPLNYISIKKRKISILSIDEINYLLLAAIDNNITDNIIQIYLIQEDTNGVLTFIEQTQEVNSNILHLLFGLPTTFKFQLIDFKLVYEIIYILDKTMVCGIYFDKNGEWYIDRYIKLSGNVIAFDYVYYIDNDGNQNKILVVLFDTKFDLYYNNENVKTYTLPNSVSQYSQIKVSHHFILIEDENTVYVYDIEHLTLILKKTLTQIGNYLINPVYPDIVAISYNLTRRYFINDGYLKLYGNQVGQYQLTLQALYNNNKITKQLQVQILYNNDATLYLNGQNKQVISSTIYQNNQTFDIVPFLSGPNLQVNIQQEDIKLNISFEYMLEMNIEGWPQPKDIYFQDMLALDDTNVYVLFQKNDYVLQIWECTQNKQAMLESCKMEKTVEITIYINTLHFQWWISSGEAYLAFCDTVYTLELWKFNNQDLIKINKIAYAYEITQILELQRTLYVLISSQKKIFIYNSLDGTKLDLIDQSTIKSLTLTTTWAPLKLYGNQKYSSHILFIKNTDTILITIYNKQINLVESIPMTQNVEITLYKDTFFLLQSNSLQEYSIKDLNNIYLMRNIQLYNHQLDNPLIFTQSEDNGFLFVQAQDKILVFQPSQNSNDILFRILDISSANKQDINSQPTLSACGYKKTHFYYTDHINQYYFAFLMQTKATVNSFNVSSTEYYSNITQAFYFQNDYQEYKFLEKVFVINTNYGLNVDTIKDVELNSSTQMNLPIQTNGQVLDYNLILSEQSNQHQVSLITPINYKYGGFIDQPKDIEIYDTEHNIILTRNQLYLLDTSDNIRQQLDFGTPNSCEQIQVYKNRIYTLCNYNNKYHIYLTICDQKCVNQNSIDLLDLQGVTKMIVIQGASVQNNILVIQDFGKFYIYYISITSENWTITLTQIIDGGRGLTDFIISQTNQESDPLFYITYIDQSDYLNLIYGTISSNNPTKITILQQSSIHIYETVISSNQFAFSTTDYIQLFHHQQTDSSLSYIIIANNVASFEFNILLKNNQINEAKVLTVLNPPYSDWTTLAKASKINNFIVIPYTNKVNVLLGLYYLDQNEQSSYNIISSIQEKAFTITDGIMINFLFTTNSNYKLYSNLPKTLNNYDIHSQAQIYLQNVTKNQIVNITASNLFEQTSISFSVTYIPDSEPNNDSSSNWWWITLIVLVSVGFVFAGVYLVMKTKKIGLFRVRSDEYSLQVQ